MATIVLDCGSRYSKIGISGEDKPRTVFRTVVGRSEHNSRDEDAFVGDEGRAKAISGKEPVFWSAPITNGIIANWVDLEAIWRYSFYSELKINPEDQFVFITERPLTPKSQRERITQIMFETFNVEGFFICQKNLIALYNSGKITGTVLHSGEGLTFTVSIYEGFSLPHTMETTSYGGQQITEYIRNHCKINLSFEQAEMLKEACCFVALSDEERKNTKDMEMAIGWGYSTTIQASMRYLATEPYFDPTLIGRSTPGVHFALKSTIHKADLDIRGDLYSNIVLSGGSTKFEGFRKRLLNDFRNLTSPGLAKRAKIVALPSRELLPWIGGSVVSSMRSFAPRWIHKAEYNNVGPGIVHRKCFS